MALLLNSYNIVNVFMAFLYIKSKWQNNLFFLYTSHKEETSICECCLGDINSIGANKWYSCDKIGCRRTTYPLSIVKRLRVNWKKWLVDAVCKKRITNGDCFKRVNIKTLWGNLKIILRLR